MSKTAATPSDWDDQSETFSDAFSDAFVVTKTVLYRLSGGGSSSSKIPPPGFFGFADNNVGSNKGGDDQLHIEQFDGWDSIGACNLKQPNQQKTSSSSTTPGVVIVEQVDSRLTMSYSSSSDTTNGREARDDFAEEGTVSSDDTSTDAPTTSTTKKATEVKIESTAAGATAPAATGGVGGLSARKRLHQKHKLRVTEVHAKKEEEQPKKNDSTLMTQDLEVARRNKVSERWAKGKERFNNRRRGGVDGGGRPSATRDGVAFPPPPPPPPPPPHHHFHDITATVRKDTGIALVMEKIESIVERRTTTHQKSAATVSPGLSIAASTDSHEELTLLVDELESLKAQIDTEVEESNNVMMVLEANLDAAKIENESLFQQLHELNQELTFSKAEKQCLADKMEDLIDKLTTVKAEKSALQFTAEGVNTANQKLAKVAAELKRTTMSLEGKVAKLEEEKRGVEIQLKEKEVIVIQLEDSAQTFNDELQSKNLEMEELTQEITNLRTQMLSLQRYVSTLQEDVAEKQKAVEDAVAYSTSLKEEVSLSNSQLEKLTQESEELIKFKADAEVRIDLLRHTMSEYSHQVIGLETKLEESQGARACLEDERTNLKESNTALAKRLAKAYAENEKKEDSMEDMNNQVDAAIKAAIDRSGDLESQVAMLQRQLHESMFRSARFEEENRDMKNRLDAAEVNAERLTQENTESDGTVADLESRVIDMIAEKRKIMTSMEELQSKADTVTKERDFAQSTVVELMSGSENTVEILETLQSEKVEELLTKLEEAEEKFKVCETEKYDYLNASALANKERERESAKYSTEISDMSAKSLKLEGNVETLTTDLSLSRSELEETKSKLENALSRARILELEYRTTVGMLEVTKGDKDKVAADLLDALNGVITSSNDKDRESTAQLTALTTERDELANKVLTINAELNNMHALVKTLKAEKNSALAKVNSLVLGNATVLESKVKEVSCRLDTEFAEYQQQLDKLNEEINELKDENWRLTKENTQLHSDKNIVAARATTLEETKIVLEATNSQLKVDKALAETRAKSLKETNAALEEIKTAKRVTWSSFATVAQINSNALNKEPMSPASSCTSGSGFLDPDIARQVNKALDMARNRRNVPKA